MNDLISYFLRAAGRIFVDRLDILPAMTRSEQSANSNSEGGGVVFPGLWRHQPLDGSDWVEIVVPQAEIDDILADARFAFPAFAASMLRLWGEAGDRSTTAWRSNPELARGFFNLLTLAMALTNKMEQPNLEEPYIGAAFRAAFDGRIKLFATASGFEKPAS